MGLLDQIVGGLTGGAGGASPIQGVLMNMLNGNQQQNATGFGSQSGGTAGGLGNLISSFEQAGLGHIVQSWVGNGPNQPVSPQQMQTVLGEDQVHNMANQSGLAPQDFLSLLGQYLPALVDRMTPSGRVPDAGTIST